MAINKQFLYFVVTLSFIFSAISRAEDLSPEKQRRLDALIGKMATKSPKTTKESYLRQTKTWAMKMEGHFKAYGKHATAYINSPTDSSIKLLEKLEKSIFTDLQNQPMPPEGSTKSDRQMQDLAAQVGSAYSAGHGGIKALVSAHYAKDQARQGALVDKMNSRFNSYKAKIPAVRKRLGLESKREVASQANQKWYEGGSLHSKTIADWQTATPHNRLATSADLISKITGELNKEKSVELESCLTAFAKGADKKLMNQKVAEIGTLCAVQLGYVGK